MEPLVNEPQDRTDPGPLDLIARSQEQMILDEELNHLPQRYRDVLVMTYFAGQNSQQIADQFNVSKGVVDGRIRQARNMLRVRLARRGVAIGVLVATASLTSPTATAAGSALVASTIQLGTQTLTGSLSAVEALSRLEPLIRPEIAMFSSKQILLAVLCLSAVATTAAISGMASGQTEGIAVSPQPPLSIAVAEVNQATDVDPFASEVSDSTAGNNILVTTTGTTPAAPGNAGGQRFKTYPSDAAPVERWMYELLDKPITYVDDPGEAPLDMVMQTLQDELNAVHRTGADDTNRVRVCFDKLALADEDIAFPVDIMIDVSQIKGLSLRNALAIIMQEARSTANLTYVIQNEVLLITTAFAAEDMYFTRVYNVDELLDLDFGNGYYAGNQGFGGGGGGFFAVPSPQQATTQAAGTTPPATGQNDMQGMGGMEGGLGGAAGQAYTPDPITLATVVMDMTSPPCSWLENDGAGGVIHIAGRSLVVRQTFQGHQEVVRLLNLLSESVADSP